MPLDTLVEKVVVSPLITINHKESIVVAAEMINTKKLERRQSLRKVKLLEYSHQLI